MRNKFLSIFLLFTPLALFPDTVFDYSTMDQYAHFDIPVVVADEINTQGFGNFVDDFENEKIELIRWPYTGEREINCGIGGGITEGLFKVHWNKDLCIAENEAVKGSYVPGIKIGQSIYTHEANYHPDSAQLFFPIDKKPFILFLSKNKTDQITPSDFIAFVFDGSRGFKVDPCVWHQPPFSGKDGVVFKDKQGAVHACIAVHFPKEFGVICKMDNALKVAEDLSKSQ